MYFYNRTPREGPSPAQPGLESRPSGLAGSVVATDPRTNTQCRAEERRIRRIVEPGANELVPIAPHYLADRTPRQLHRAAYEAYLRMKTAAEADGIPANLLTITSGYRGVAHQQRLWADALKKYGSPQAAHRWVAPPGRSPHHTGRAIDFSLGTRNSSENIPALRATPAYKWLVCNAARFGFYPYANEPWHWEFNPSGLDTTGTSPAPIPGAMPEPGSVPLSHGELRLIQNAINRGVREVSGLTDLVFYARHPERRGQPLRRNEQRLVTEWMEIRDRLVRPALGRIAATRPTPVAPAAPVRVLSAPTARVGAVAGLDPQHKLDRVHPELANRVRRMAEALVRRGIPIRVTSGLRTFAEQDALYAQGRTRPGNVVTKARGGYSNHNYGLAVDVVPLANGRPNWNVPDKVWQAIGEEGKRARLSWGGDWKGFVDRPHFELPVGMSVQECLRIYRQGGLEAVWAEASRRL